MNNCSSSRRSPWDELKLMKKKWLQPILSSFYKLCGQTFHPLSAKTKAYLEESYYYFVPSFYLIRSGLHFRREFESIFSSSIHFHRGIKQKKTNWVAPKFWKMIHASRNAIEYPKILAQQLPKHHLKMIQKPFIDLSKVGTTLLRERLWTYLNIFFIPTVSYSSD